ELFGMSTASPGYAAPGWWSPVALGVNAPRITSVPAVVSGGVPATITGLGFTRMTAVGSAGSGPRADVVPSVVFAPADGGGSVPSDVTAWSDTSITWVPPISTRRGPGWVHVIVQGVPSNGAFLALHGAPGGGACASDVACATGVCAGGVCCDRVCTGCET